MYNLIEYSDKYSDTSGSLWQFKRDEIEGNVDLTVNAQHIPNNSSSFKYKSSLITNRNCVKIAESLKYLTGFWISLEMLLINCKVELSIRWDSNCVLSNLVGASTFTITDIKLYVPIPTWSREDNAKLFKNIKWRISSLLEQIQSNSKQTMSCRWLHMRITSCQGVNRLFVLAYRDGGGADRVTADSHRRNFLPRVKMENSNIGIDGRNLYDQPINDLIKQYDEVRKVSTRQCDDYATGYLLDFAYFEKITD